MLFLIRDSSRFRNDDIIETDKEDFPINSESEMI
jgi:hypothetical protein